MGVVLISHVKNVLMNFVGIANNSTKNISNIFECYNLILKMNFLFENVLYMNITIIQIILMHREYDD